MQLLAERQFLEQVRTGAVRYAAAGEAGRRNERKSWDDRKALTAAAVRDFEPRVALDGGPDGMSVLRTVAEESSMALRPGGALFMELSAEHGHAEQMRPCLEQLGFEDVRVLNDYLGTNRFITGRLSEGA